MAWQPPSVEQSVRAVLATRPPPEVAALAECGLFPPMPPPGPADWLADGNPGVKERGGQSLEQWRARGRAPGKTRTILLVPLGDVGQDVDVEALSACVRAFYLGMDVRCLPPVPPEVLEKRVTSRASRGFGRQLLTKDLHELLAEVKTPDSYVVMGFTMHDLYPRDEWNFVFGQAMAGKGTGVFSFARYRTRSASAFLRRCCMVLTHEIGHLFGVAHCVSWHCCMNGSNHDEEADSRPMAMCPGCLRKLREAIGPSFDLATRDAALAEFLRHNGLPELAEFHLRSHAVVSGVCPVCPGAKAGPPRRAAAGAAGRSGARPVAGPVTGRGAARRSSVERSKGAEAAPRQPAGLGAARARSGAAEKLLRAGFSGSEQC